MSRPTPPPAPERSAHGDGRLFSWRELSGGAWQVYAKAGLIHWATCSNPAMAMTVADALEQHYSSLPPGH